MNAYAVARVTEIDEVDDGRCLYRPVRHHFGITSFGVNVWTAREAGDRIINEHDEAHRQEEELYFVQEGHARFELDGMHFDAPTGTFIFARPSVRRTAFAQEPQTTVVVVGGLAGMAYEPQGLEEWAPLRPLYESGRYGEVADRLYGVVEAHPEYPALTYNLACCESLAGRTGDAIDHLRRAIERSERFRALAVDDTDFDLIRDQAAFQELINS
jgi:hypothetical protein